jgi:putative ABC transport system permease protein
MQLFNNDKFQEIWYTIKQNKLRTFFTAFGVFWGIFMLVVMLGAGKGLHNGVSTSMGDMATNSMFMWGNRTTMPYKGFVRGRWVRFDNDDTRALAEQIPEIEYLAPRLQVFATEGQNNVVREERTAAYSIQGDYPDYNKIDPSNILKGRFINDNDIGEKRKVVVIGKRVAEEMFKPDENPIGQYLKINGVFFQVVGVSSSKKNDQQAEEENRQVFMPFTTIQSTYNMGNRVGWYSITAKEGYSAADVLEKAKTVMKTRHSIDPEDSRAIGSFNVEEEFLKMTRLFAGISGLIWIVGIGTLFAGVIGVSNIMLIIVKERTKEIGVQRALGATPWQIRKQIIIESVLLTSFAGYFGLVVGVGILELINYLLIKMGAGTQMFNNPEVDFQKAVLALVLLVISGALAGLIPANRAVSIKPIDALRDE